MNRARLLVGTAFALAAPPAAELAVRVATGFDGQVGRRAIAQAGAWMRSGLVPEDGRAARDGADSGAALTEPPDPWRSPWHGAGH